MNKSRKALVLGYDNRAFLSVIRSLGRARIQVDIAWHEQNEVLHSRYINQMHIIPPYTPGSSLWLDAMVNLLKTEKYDLVIPCEDARLMPFQKFKDELGKYSRLYTISDEAFDALFDKIKTNNLARELGIPVPREMIVDNLEAIHQITSDFNFPIVLKPQRSFDEKKLHDRNSVKKAYTEDQLQAYLADMLSVGPVIVQENFIGEGVGVELLLKDGQPLLTFQHERIHEPLLGGGSSYRKGVAVNPELLTASVKILGHLRYTGVAMVEFKYNRESKQWIFVEVNARFWGSLPLAIASGANFPLALFEMLVDGKTDFPQAYRTGLYCRSIFLDLVWQRDNLLADHSDRTLATRPVWRILLDCLVNKFTLRERYDTFTIDDPLPGFFEIVNIIKTIISYTVAFIGGKIVSLILRRKSYKEQVIKKFCQAKTVLFVCKGNISRSPFAELLLKKHSEKTVLSAGYYPEENRQAPDVAVEVAAQWNVSLAEHRSRVLNESMIRQADIIFIFDYDNYIQVSRVYPTAKDKISFLGALCNSGNTYIQDPWGKDNGAFKEAYSKIDEVVTNILTEEDENGSLI